MDNRPSMLLFFVLVALAIFTFVFCVDALALPNVFYGVLALLGFVFCLGLSIFQLMLMKRDGSSIAIWFSSFTVVVGIVFVWYITRCGTVFGWW